MHSKFATVGLVLALSVALTVAAGNFAAPTEPHFVASGVHSEGAAVEATRITVRLAGAELACVSVD